MKSSGKYKVKIINDKYETEIYFSKNKGEQWVCFSCGKGSDLLELVSQTIQEFLKKVEGNDDD